MARKRKRKRKQQASVPGLSVCIIARDEGERGLVLQWSDPSPEARSYLSRMIEFLPVIATRPGTHQGTGVVVSEILDHRERDEV